MYVTPEQYGAIGNGIADDGPAWIAAVASGMPIICPPNRVYRVTSSLGLVSQGVTIDLQNSTILADYSDVAAYPAWSSESLFRVIDADSVTIKNGRLQYLGTVSGVPYTGGNIAGVFVSGSDDFRAENLKAHGFNVSGLMLGISEAGAAATPYCRRPRVIDCELTGSRAAGVLFGNTEDLILRDNTCNDNGDPLDGGTGYGIAGNSTYNPIDTLVDNNTCNGNARKGIDFHAGHGGKIINNKCLGNLQFGIFVEDCTGSWVISGNNPVGGMTTASCPPGYTAIYGLYVGTTAAGTLADEPVTYTMFGNVVRDFTISGSGVAFPIYIAGANLREGDVKLIGNTVIAGTVTGIVGCQNAAGPSWWDCTISDNTFIADNSLSTPILLRGATCRKKTFTANNLWLKTNLNALLYAYTTTTIAGRSSVVTDNIIQHGVALTGDYTSRDSQSVVSGNVVNGTPRN